MQASTRDLWPPPGVLLDRLELALPPLLLLLLLLLPLLLLLFILLLLPLLLVLLEELQLLLPPTVTAAPAADAAAADPLPGSARMRVRAAAASSRALDTLEVSRRSTSGSEDDDTDE